MQILEKRLDEIKPYERNPRKNDEAVKYVAASIKEFGFKVPLVIDSDGVIVCGHTRYKAAQELGLPTVPCIMADDLTPEQIKAFRLADNKTAEIATWDDELLSGELADILDIDMGDFGFGLDDEEEEEPEVTDDNYNVAAPEESKAKRGDIYQLGDHRLMCGDATDADDVITLMDGIQADLLLTDPPYNVDYGHKQASLNRYDNGNRNTSDITNDKMTDKDFLEFLECAFTNGKEAIKAGAAFYIWHAAGRDGLLFRQALDEVGLQVHQTLVWNKNRFVLGLSDYHYKHEPCLYGWKDGATHYFTDSRTEVTVFEDKLPDVDKMKKPELVELLKQIYADRTNTTVIKEDKPARSDLHPTMKPLPLMGRLIKNSSRQGEVVLDLFGGSGSTLMACEQLNRKCYMLELDPKYVDVIIDRWQEFTGKEAVKVN